MSEARMATEEDFNRHLMSIPCGEGLVNFHPDPRQTGGDGGPHMEAVAGVFTRATLEDGLRLISTPKDEPNFLSQMWDESIKGLIAQQTLQSDFVVIPQQYPVTFKLDTVPIVSAVTAALMCRLGQVVTDRMVREVADRVAAEISELSLLPNPKTTFENDSDAPVVVEGK